MDNAQDDKVQEEYLPPYHNFNGITSQHGAHFILKIDNILMKEKYYNAILTELLSQVFDGKIKNEKETLLGEVAKVKV